MWVWEQQSTINMLGLGQCQGQGNLTSNAENTELTIIFALAQMKVTEDRFTRN